MKVLVVEDDEFTRTLLQGAVASLGHEVSVAVDGLHAWSHIQMSTPDVIISDWATPGIDGLELCARVRSLEGSRAVYFLLVAPEAQRSTAVNAMEGGVDDHLLKPVDLEELHGRLVVAARWVQVHRQLSAYSDELELAKLALRESAERDPLTRSYNRLRFSEDAAAIKDRVARYGHRYAVALFDIDHFRAYNDTYGHVAGDEALIHVAGLISKHRRAGDAVYRYGDKQFLLLLPEQTAEGARVAAERIRLAIIRAPVHHAHLDADGHVTVSVGIAELPGPERDLDEVLDRAGQALHVAKRSGRNRIAIDEGAPVPPDPDRGKQ